jgi:hypothetical protein
MTCQTRTLKKRKRKRKYTMMSTTNATTRKSRGGHRAPLACVLLARVLGVLCLGLCALLEFVAGLLQLLVVLFSFR